LDINPRCSRIFLGALASIRKFLEAVPGSIKHHLNIEELARVSIASLAAGGGFFGILQAVVTSASTVFLSPGDAALAVGILTLIIEVHRRLGHGVAPETAPKFR
jgi:hypothetical protein